MDANGAHFHLLLGKPDWAYCTDAHGHRLATFWDESPPGSAEALLHWDQARSELTLQPRLLQFLIPLLRSFQDPCTLRL